VFVVQEVMRLTFQVVLGTAMPFANAFTTPCCYLALIVQLDWRDRTVPDVARADLPLFPQCGADAAREVLVVKSIEHIASMLGEDLANQQDRNRVGGHYIRVTGARRLARLVIPTATFMLLAR